VLEHPQVRPVEKAAINQQDFEDVRAQVHAGLAHQRPGVLGLALLNRHHRGRDHHPQPHLIDDEDL
jgi:hypothetical protein